MLYLLGGAARAGKSASAQRFHAETGVPYFCLDYLMMGFAGGLPAYGVDPEDDELHVADLLWPVVRAMAQAMVENGLEYCLEGVQLRPRHVAVLGRLWPDSVRACFVGYAESDPVAKMRQLRAYGGGMDDWMHVYSEAQMLAEVRRLVALSGAIRDECAEHGLVYFEEGSDLQETITRVVEYLREGTWRKSSRAGDTHG